MCARRIRGLDLLAFQELEALPNLLHGVTTRQIDLAAAGTQAGPNLERLRRALGLRRLVWVRQVHGTHIVPVNGEEALPAAQADGLATDRPGVGLLIKQADCQAVILAAPQRGVIANLHAGWRGNAAGMPGKGVEFLAQRYGVEPNDLYAAVSPSLGACCGEFVNWLQGAARLVRAVQGGGKPFRPGGGHPPPTGGRRGAAPAHIHQRQVHRVPGGVFFLPPRQDHRPLRHGGGPAGVT